MKIPIVRTKKIYVLINWSLLLRRWIGAVHDNVTNFRNSLESCCILIYDWLKFCLWLNPYLYSDFIRKEVLKHHTILQKFYCTCSRIVSVPNRTRIEPFRTQTYRYSKRTWSVLIVYFANWKSIFFLIQNFSYFNKKILKLFLQYLI